METNGCSDTTKNKGSNNNKHDGYSAPTYGFEFVVRKFTNTRVHFSFHNHKIFPEKC